MNWLKDNYKIILFLFFCLIWLMIGVQGCKLIMISEPDSFLRLLLCIIGSFVILFLYFIGFQVGFTIIKKTDWNDENR